MRKKNLLLNQFGLISLTLSPFWAVGTGQPDAKSSQPNIIFILTDDHRWDALGYTGNPVIKTPALDKLAREGAFFRNAFVTTPICAASRASILTGLYERTHGYTFQQGPLKEAYQQLSYPVLLKQQDYHTGFFGKLGVTAKNAESLFDVADIYDRNDQFPDRRGYFYKTIETDTVHLTRYTGHQACQFIRDTPSGKPFCLSLSFSAPHAHDKAPEQYFWQKKSEGRYADAIIPPPLLGDETYFNALPKEVKEGFNRLRWTWRFDTPERYQQYVKGYYRMISEIDDEISLIRKTLDEQGLAENTVIMVMGDNGYFLGDRQLADKWLMYDVSLRVPLIIYDPRVKKHQDIKDMALNIDIPFTILDLTGISGPKEYQGISLQPYLNGGNPRKIRKALLFEHLWKLPQIPSSEGIRTEKWKYFRYRFIQAPEELYDLENDPLETENLAQIPAYGTILNKLRRECDKQIARYTKAKLVPDFTPADQIDLSF